ncbi:MAG: dockerin type I repeat-containing protein [Spirochaetales bacterium]|nr:dockerin type I repeat-containing protein [Spirochaetales bacterium]
MKKMFIIVLIVLQLPLYADIIGRTGDVNGDVTVNIVDALLIAQAYVGIPVPVFDRSAADVNCSGKYDIVDSLLIAQFYVGLIREFPCDKPEIPRIRLFGPIENKVILPDGLAYAFYENTIVDVTFSIENIGTGILELTGVPVINIVKEDTSQGRFSVL